MLFGQEMDRAYSTTVAGPAWG